MAYLLNFGPDYAHDIFVSYAHGPVITEWSQEFAKDLVEQVNYSLKEKDAERQVELWMDNSLQGNLRLTPQLSGKVRKSALLVVIMSEFYLGSNWCNDEASWFEEARGGWANTDGRIFVVQIEPTNRARWPSFLRDERNETIPGYVFYEHRPGEDPRTLAWPRPSVTQDKAYWKALPTLAEQIAKQLKLVGQQLQNASQPPPGAVVDSELGSIKHGPMSVARGRPTVFLAIATEDVDDIRSEVQSILASNFDVVPVEDAVDPARIPELLARHLPSCDAFVQVVGAWSGKGGYVQFQHTEAVRSGKPLFVWRCPDTAFESKDEAFKTFLASLKPSAAADAKAFVSEVKGILEPAVPGRRKVFVEAVPEDQELRRQLRQLLLGKGLRVLPFRDKPAPVRSVREISATDEAWVDEMLRCDAIVYLNGSGPDKWLERAMLDLWDITSRRGGEVKRVAVVDKPAGPPLEPFDPEIPVFRFDRPDFLDSFTRWINQGRAAA